MLCSRDFRGIQPHCLASKLEALAADQIAAYCEAAARLHTHNLAVTGSKPPQAGLNVPVQGSEP